MRSVPVTLCRTAASAASACSSWASRSSVCETSTRAHATPDPFEQRNAGLALEYRQLLRHGGWGERERARDRRDRFPVGQLTEQAQPTQIEHKQI